MAKIKVDYILTHKDEIIRQTAQGIKNNNSIVFKDQEVMFNLTILDDKVLLTRKNDEYVLELELSKDKSKGTYLIDKIGNIELKLILKELIIEDDKIKIEYILNDELFVLELNYEVIE